MTTYKLLDICVNTNDGIYINCTDPDTIQTIIRDAQQYMPSMRSKSGTYGAMLDKLQGREHEVLWWIMQYLCRSGWEPLGATEVKIGYGHSFRIEES